MNDKRHHTFDVLYRRFANYGREIPTDDTAKCPDEITLAMSALMRLVGVVDDICASITRNEMLRIHTDAYADCARSGDKWIKELESRHGTAPETVLEYVDGLIFRRTDHIVANVDRWSRSWMRSIDVIPSDMPANVRKDYNRWRKRRIKKEMAR